MSMKLLFLSSWFPYPPNNGSKLRIYNLLQGLAQQHQITLLSFTDQLHSNQNAAELRALCHEIQVVAAPTFQPQSWRTKLAWLNTKPRSVVGTFSPEMKGCIEQALANRDYDLIIASQWGIAGYGHYFQGLPALFEEVELGLYHQQFAQASSLRARIRYGLTWAKHRNYIAQLLRYFRVCTVTSHQEKGMLSQIAPCDKTIHVIPNCVRVADYNSDYNNGQSPQPNTLIFTGPFRYHANYDAMLWFLHEVYPQIQAQLPAVRLIITGDHANLPVPSVRNVTLTGMVDDVRPLVAQAWVSLAPIRIGGGTRLKILEAMALGTAVVTTSKGAEGLDILHDVHALIADSADTFAEAVIRLLQDPNLRKRLADSARQLVHEKFNWDAVLPHFQNVVELAANNRLEA
jgi:glycosyltransferase involved in cell wall biosynthesis